MVRGREPLTDKEKSYKKILAENLNQLLKAEQKSKVDVRKGTGIPVSTLTDYFQARNLPVSANVKKLAKFFDVPASTFDPRLSDEDYQAEIVIKSASVKERKVIYEGEYLTVIVRPSKSSQILLQ